MKISRATIRARLVAGLDNHAAIEERPIEEVLVDLKRMGLDPGPSIEMTRSLAAMDDDDPAAELLRRIEKADALDEEIGALEKAPFDDVLASLSTDLAQTGEAATDETNVPPSSAEKEAGEAAEVPVKRRRRFAALGLGGSIVGIAASILLLVFVRPDLLEQLEGSVTPYLEIDRFSSTEEARPVPEEARRQGTVTTASESNPPSVKTAGPAQPARLPADIVASSNAGPASDDRANAPTALPAEEPAAFAPGLTSDTVENAALDAAEQLSTRSERVAPSGLADESEASARVTSGLFERPPLPERRPDDLLEGPALAEVQGTAAGEADQQTEGLAGLPSNLQSIVIVDADRAPAALERLAAGQSDDRLAARLGDASLRALGRKVLALVSFERDGQTVDAVLVEHAERQAAGERSSQSAVTFNETPPSPGPAFDLLELP